MMPLPHEKLPTCGPRNGQLLARMQHKFLCALEFASQVPTLPDPDIFTFDTKPEIPTTAKNRVCSHVMLCKSNIVLVVIAVYA